MRLDQFTRCNKTTAKLASRILGAKNPNYGAHNKKIGGSTIHHRPIRSVGLQQINNRKRVGQRVRFREISGTMMSAVGRKTVMVDEITCIATVFWELRITYVK